MPLNDAEIRALVVEITMLASRHAGWVPDDALFGLLEQHVPFDAASWTELARVLDHSASELAAPLARRFRDFAGRVYMRATSSRV